MEQSAYALHARTEERHWWFVARRRILQHVLASLALPERTRLVEFGAGTGGNLSMLSRFGTLTAIEPNDEARAICATRQSVATAPSLAALPDRMRFDVALALDVLEHLDDPIQALKDLHHRLDGARWLLVTVPAHPWLFGEHDRYLHHHRRYTPGLLRTHLVEGGFTPVLLSPMNCALFPAAIAARAIEAARTWWMPKQAPRARGMAMPPSAINWLLTELFAAERGLVLGERLPFGLSLLVLSRGDHPAGGATVYRPVAAR